MIEALQAWPWTRLAALTVVLLSAVFALEVITGRDVNVAELYLVPIAAMTFARGFRAGLAVAATAAILGLATDLWRTQHLLPAFIPAWNWGIRGVSFVAFAGLLSAMAERLVRETALARTDGLTGAVNRVAFRELLALELERAKRAGRPLALGYVDLDKFKDLNDSLGHDEGDRVLRAVVEVSQHTLRRSDLVFRLGGDEFAWILPTAADLLASAVAERVRKAWNERALREGWPVRLSIGVATLAPGEGSAEALVGEADRAMYEAKRAGGDRVLAAEVTSEARAPGTTEALATPKRRVDPAVVSPDDTNL
jgi:diguanylate cyclase (GGDEF)-like protein